MRIARILSTYLQTDANGKRYSDISSIRYRTLMPALAGAELGIETALFPPNHYHLFNPNDYDYTIVGKNLNPDKTDALLAICQQLADDDHPRYFDICDDWFNTANIAHVKPYQQAYFKQAVNYFNDFIANSDEMASIIKNNIARDINVTVIGDPYEGPKSEIKTTIITNNQLNLLWYGHYQQVNFKPLLDLLPSLGEFSKKIKLNLEVVSSLNDEEQNFLQHQCQAYTDFNINHTPWSLDSTWQAFQKNTIILIPFSQTQRKLGQGANRLIEALWAGCHVVSNPPAACTAYHEFADYCYLQTDIIKSLEALLDNQALAIDKIKQGQVYIEKHFSPTVIGAQWANLKKASN